MQLEGNPYWTYKIGDKVHKISGSSWRGVVVGFYQSSLTEEGYAVESDTEIGSVQIYPAKALEHQPCKLNLCDGSGEITKWDPPIEPHLPATPAENVTCKCRE